MLCCTQDYGELLQTHRSSDADITIATHAVGMGQASFRGCCKVEPDTGAAPAPPPAAYHHPSLHDCAIICPMN